MFITRIFDIIAKFTCLIKGQREVETIQKMSTSCINIYCYYQSYTLE